MNTQVGQGDTSPDARWMTFAEIAAARCISKASAVKLVQRHKWRRQRDNEGHVRALVPPAWQQVEEDSRPDGTPDSRPDLARVTSAFEASLATLREQIDRERQRGDRAEADRDRERNRAAEAEAQVAHERAARLKAEADVDALRKTDSDRRARGIVSRVRAALRGE